MKKLLLYLVTFTLSLTWLRASDSKTTIEIFQQANEQYQNGSFYESIDSYEKILAMGFENFPTYYNLGNAYYKSNQLPEAIYFYEKALQLKPRHEDAKHNLALANSLIQKDTQSVPEAFHIRLADQIMKQFNTRGWAILTIIFFIITLVFVANFLLQASLKLKRTMFYLSFAGIILTASAWFFGYRLYSASLHPTHAIVMTSSAGIKSSPDQSSADVYVSQAGTKVKIISSLGDWYEVRVPDGNKGWVMAGNIRLL